MPDTPTQKKYKLTIDTRILELLGPSLYTNIYYVLAELIANAYDAMAHNVYIISNKDDITVEDDGTGMSYENGDIAHYLDVAKESRTTEDQSWTADKSRKKMGRKGVGKLAALSVSETVLVKTRYNKELSGFILTRHVAEDSYLTPITENQITFQIIEGNGSSIVMQSPQYHLHKTLSVVKKNLLKIFPAVCKDFRIHVIRGKDHEIIDSFDDSAMNDLCAIISWGGEEYSSLTNIVMKGHPHRNELVLNYPAISIPVDMCDRNKIKHQYQLEIVGWLGTYKTTRGRKAEITDFPDNFISLYANNKMGEFNILPIVGQNKLNEVYVVGQLHIDLFELTELPDMALSNRQGYKTDDPRYEAVLTHVRSEMLPAILELREHYTDIKSAEKKKLDEEKLLQKESDLKTAISSFRKEVTDSSLKGFEKNKKGLSPEIAIQIVQDSLNAAGLNIGLKQEVDSLKKKILISQTGKDKLFADVVYKMLLHNSVPCHDILYTNCDDEDARIPEGEKVYEYLRKFFVESYSTKKIYVIFITSHNTKESWGALTEVGAAWITKIDHKIFNVYDFKPEHPLDDESTWQTTHRENDDLWMDFVNADIFCSKIEAICKYLGYQTKERKENMRYLKTLVSFR